MNANVNNDVGSALMPQKTKMISKEECKELCSMIESLDAVRKIIQESGEGVQ